MKVHEKYIFTICNDVDKGKEKMDREKVDRDRKGERGAQGRG